MCGLACKLLLDRLKCVVHHGMRYACKCIGVKYVWRCLNMRLSWNIEIVKYIVMAHVRQLSSQNAEPFDFLTGKACCQYTVYSKPMFKCRIYLRCVFICSQVCTQEPSINVRMCTFLFTLEKEHT